MGRLLSLPEAGGWLDLPSWVHTEGGFRRWAGIDTYSTACAAICIHPWMPRLPFLRRTYVDRLPRERAAVHAESASLGFPILRSIGQTERHPDPGGAHLHSPGARHGFVPDPPEGPDQGSLGTGWDAGQLRAEEAGHAAGQEVGRSHGQPGTGGRLPDGMLGAGGEALVAPGASGEEGQLVQGPRGAEQFGTRLGDGLFHFSSDEASHEGAQGPEEVPAALRSVQPGRHA